MGYTRIRGQDLPGLIYLPVEAGKPPHPCRSVPTCYMAVFFTLIKLDLAYLYAVCESIMIGAKAQPTENEEQ